MDSFRPDIKSNSFQRLLSEMNTISRLPKFFALAMIKQKPNPHVRDDTIFIKIMVDVGDMSKTPIHIQQLLIKKEVMLSQQSIKADFNKDHFNDQQSST